MSSTTTVTGNLGGVDLRFTPSGKAVLNLSLADNHNRFDKDKQEWVQTGTTWYRMTLWEDHAQNAADTLQKGDRVIVTGRVEMRAFKDKDGNDREALEIHPQEIGKAVSKFAPKNGSGGASTTGGFAGTSGAGWGNDQPAQDPWGGQPSGGGGSWGTPDSNDPPF